MATTAGQPGTDQGVRAFQIPAQATSPDRRRATISRSARAVVVLCYVATIVLSFLPGLAILAFSRRGRAPFVARHAAQALNTALTTILYGICAALVGGLLALDSPHFGVQVAITGGVFFWLLALGYLVSAAAAGLRGRRYRIPLCLCADFAHAG
jgi:uncharacterized Tic20 family protein